MPNPHRTETMLSVKGDRKSPYPIAPGAEFSVDRSTNGQVTAEYNGQTFKGTDCSVRPAGRNWIDLTDPGHVNYTTDDNGDVLQTLPDGSKVSVPVQPEDQRQG